MEKDNQSPSSIADILKEKSTGKKPPAYPWQDLALKIERELAVPKFKRSSIFKVCRDYPRPVIERALADTKELCQSGQPWRYFFKILVQDLHSENIPIQHAPHQKETRKIKDAAQDQHHSSARKTEPRPAYPRKLPL